MRGRHLERYVRLPVLVWVLLLLSGGLADRARAAEWNWVLETRALYSDNIERQREGREVDGNLFSLEAGIEVDHQAGQNNYALRGVGGWERVEGTETSTNNIYQVDADLIWPVSGFTTLGLQATASRQTNLQEVDNLDRSRTLEDRSRLSLTFIGRETYPLRSFDTYLWTEEIKRDTETTNTASLGGNLDIPAGLGKSIQVAASALVGEGKESDDRWRENRYSAVIQISSAKKFLYGGETFLYASETNPGNPLDEDVEFDNLGLILFVENYPSPQTTLVVSLGTEGLKEKGSERDWSERGRLTFKSQVSNRTSLALSAAQENTLGQRADRTPVWSRRSLAEATLVWRTTSTLTATVNAIASKDDFDPSQFGFDRQDNRLVTTLGLSWRTSEDSDLALTANREKIDSNDDLEDLKENSLELTFVSLF
ncbi:MAG: hypothetical protein JSV26_11410 [bacterium]|nr:MAG: hypothetical protein JSV26_11410 [bacterium]